MEHIFRRLSFKYTTMCCVCVRVRARTHVIHVVECIWLVIKFAEIITKFQPPAIFQEI